MFGLDTKNATKKKSRQKSNTKRIRTGKRRSERLRAASKKSIEATTSSNNSTIEERETCRIRKRKPQSNKKLREQPSAVKLSTKKKRNFTVQTTLNEYGYNSNTAEVKKVIGKNFSYLDYKNDKGFYLWRKDFLMQKEMKFLTREDIVNSLNDSTKCKPSEVKYKESNDKTFVLDNNNNSRERYPYKFHQARLIIKKLKFPMYEPQLIAIAVAFSRDNTRDYHFVFGGSTFYALMTKTNHNDYMTYQLPGTKTIIVTKDNYNKNRSYEDSPGLAFERLMTKTGTAIEETDFNCISHLREFIAFGTYKILVVGECDGLDENGIITECKTTKMKMFDNDYKKKFYNWDILLQMISNGSSKVLNGILNENKDLIRIEEYSLSEVSEFVNEKQKTTITHAELKNNLHDFLGVITSAYDINNHSIHKYSIGKDKFSSITVYPLPRTTEYKNQYDCISPSSLIFSTLHKTSPEMIAEDVYRKTKCIEMDVDLGTMSFFNKTDVVTADEFKINTFENDCDRTEYKM